jgi:hypothetical protein
VARIARLIAAHRSKTSELHNSLNDISVSHLDRDDDPRSSTPVAGSANVLYEERPFPFKETCKPGNVEVAHIPQLP